MLPNNGQYEAGLADWVPTQPRLNIRKMLTLHISSFIWEDTSFCGRFLDTNHLNFFVSFCFSSYTVKWGEFVRLLKLLPN